MRYQGDDQTRKILDLIREGRLTNKTLLNEQGELTPVDQMTPTDDFETATADVETDQNVGEDRNLEDAELKEEEDKFRQTVHNRVKFNKFKLYPNSQNVEWSGEFTDNRIQWNYSLDDSQGVYISCELTQLREDTLKVLQKLSGYYKTWSDEWATRISEEYKPEEDMSTEEASTEGGFEPGDDLPEETTV